MIGQLASGIAEGYMAPRRSTRRLLDGGYGLDTALPMLALAYLIEAILATLFGAGGGATGIGGHLLNLVQLLLMFFVLSGVIWGIGRLADGKGTLEGAQLVVAWHALVTSPLSPLAIGVASAAIGARSGDGAAPAGVGIMAFLYVAISFWLMANYVAELHGFRSTWSVLAAIIGVTFAFGILMGSILGAVSPS